MKGLLLSATAFIALALPAAAADMPEKAKQYGPPPVVSCNWCGFETGVFGGGGWSFLSPDQNISPFSDPKGKGYMIGGYARYLWDYKHIVGGFTVDYAVADINEDQSATFKGFPVGSSVGLHSKIDALASVRGNIGVSIGQSILLYGTAGLGYGKANVDIDYCAASKACIGVASARESLWGWVAGAGLDWKIANNIVIGAEYLHFDFGSQSYNFTLASFPIVLGARADTTVDVVKAKLGFRF